MNLKSRLPFMVLAVVVAVVFNGLLMEEPNLMHGIGSGILAMVIYLAVSLGVEKVVKK